MPCSVLSVDASDEIGSHHINNGDMYKQVIDSNGIPIG
jgi:hypothetical protein